MNKVVGIQFRNSGKIYDFDPGPFVLKENDQVMVITDDGPAIGSVCIEPQTRGDDIPKRELKKIFRLATKEEIEKFERSCTHENEIYDYCYKKIKERGLPMYLASVAKHFDGSKIIVYFTAEGRVDFRALVKDLVRQFRTRIEMRQIGVRQQAKIVGGLGPCGRPLCCTTFLDNFAPVTIKMAKCQNISLNPNKISGMCGRLMCCLAYEHKFYERIKKELPKIGKKVTTREGEGKVVRQHVLKERLTVLLENGNELDVTVGDLVRDSFFKKKPKKGRKGKGSHRHEKQK